MASPHGDGPGFGSMTLPPGASTCAEPPPERTPTSACDADERDGRCGGGLERQNVAGVLEQHDALFFDVLGVVAAAEGIDHAADRRIVDDARGEHAAQDAMHHVVEAGQWEPGRLRLPF